MRHNQEDHEHIWEEPLMRRTPVISAAIVAVLAAGGILAVSGGAQAPTGQTIQFTERGGNEKYVDVAPRAKRRFQFGAGDSFLFSNRLFDGANKRVGRLDVRCSITVGGRSARGTCVGVFALPDGDLHAAARLSTASETNGAITGGTRAYAGARGTFKTVDPGEDSNQPTKTTITLLP